MLIAEVVGSMPRNVYTLAPGDSIADTVDLLAEYGIGAVVVTSDGKTIEGILSERDIVRHLAREQEGTLRIKVEDLMTRSVITASLGDETEATIGVMLKGRFRHMPVVDADGDLHGLVSLGDLVAVRLNLGD